VNDETCWTLIRDAAAGRAEARSRFALRYLPVVKAYLGARWRGSPFAAEIDDAAQEVFVDCFRPGGVLERAEPSAANGFRAFLYGVARNAALHVETRRAREAERREETTFYAERIASDEDRLSKVFDRAWAQSVMREAGDLQAARASEKGEEALRRVELLRLRFHEGMPIREIARLWGEEPDHLHHEYAQARREFHEALSEVVVLHQRCPPGRAEEECARLLDLLR
jgi:RNA polymerase sigma factor (sigma-70 family)